MTTFKVFVTESRPMVGQSGGTFIQPVGTESEEKAVGTYQVEGYELADSAMGWLLYKGGTAHYVSWNGHWGSKCRVALHNQYDELVKGNLEKS